ncbi:MAG TPA: hypothetical protein VJ603_07195 [Paucimonas sp.]|nr:hypothetical protein [Paucimonas sp.]HJW56330.1 hypothetical protein [Burkholderiaceae bacterium]
MDKKPNPEWDPRFEAVLNDQITAYDDMQHHCPMAHSEYLYWSLFRHEDVMRVLLAPQKFSSVVSSQPSVPNGMDPPQHAVFRRITLMRASANRDPSQNLLHGAGMHVCPGAPLLPWIDRAGAGHDTTASGR